MFILEICPDAAGATKTRRKKEIRFRNKNGKNSKKLSGKSDKYNPDTDPPPKPVRLACRVLPRRQEFRTSPIPPRPTKTFVQPAWPVHAPAEIPAEFFHAREGVLRTFSLPPSRLFITSSSSLHHLFHIRKIPTGFSGYAKKPSGSRNLFFGKYGDVPAVSSEKSYWKFPYAYPGQKACAYGSLVESRGCFPDAAVRKS